MLQPASIISVSPDVMSGTPVFPGTRVPVQTLLDYLKAGDSINDFLEGFPTVTKDQVLGLLEEENNTTQSTSAIQRLQCESRLRL